MAVRRRLARGPAEKGLTGVVCAAACLALATSAGAQSADPALEKPRQSYEQAFAKGDANAVAAHYAEDALAVNADGVHHGRAAIAKSMAAKRGGARVIVGHRAFAPPPPGMMPAAR